MIFHCAHLPTSSLFFKGSLGDPRVRASNEHIPIVRVPRAGGRPGYPSHPSETARCTSTEDHRSPSPLCSGSKGSAGVSLQPFSSPRLSLADNDAERIASLGEGPHIGQYVSALFLRETSLPGRHIWFTLMNRLEQIGIGFLSGRR